MTLTKAQVLITLCHFCNDYYSGQWSTGYRYLCLAQKALMNMGVYYPIDIKLNKAQSRLYKYLESKYIDKM